MMGELFQALKIGEMDLAGTTRREATGGVSHALTLPRGYAGVVGSDAPGEYRIAVQNGQIVQFAVDQYVGLGYPCSAPTNWCGGLVVSEIIGNELYCDATNSYGDARPSETTPVLVCRQVPILLPTVAALTMLHLLASGNARIDGGDGWPFGDWGSILLAANTPFAWASGEPWPVDDFGPFCLAWAQGEAAVDLMVALLYESTS